MATATRSTLDTLLPGVSTAVDAYDATLIDVELDRAAAFVGGSDFWGTELEQAEGRLTLHNLARLGHLAQAGVEDPGESGVTQSRSNGATSMGYNVPAFPGVDMAQLGTTRWGRDLFEQISFRLALVRPTIVSTGY
jgi:hypothetical protein